MSFMKTENDLVALMRDMLKDMMRAVASIQEKVMVGEVEVRRHGLLTSPFESNRSKRVPLFPKPEAARTLLPDDVKSQGFGLNNNLSLRRNLR